jgi:rubrerythrin
MKSAQLKELLLQSVEHERGGVQVYRVALECAVNRDLKEEWKKYLRQTEKHVQVLQDVCRALKLDPDEETPGREVVRGTGVALVRAMEMALKAGDAAAAQLVACECVVLAETKDHLDWELLSEASKHLTGTGAKTLAQAVEEVEDEEDEHLYHSKGWCRELWLESLGMEAVLPPPEEKKDVKTAIDATRAEQERMQMR